MDCASVSFATAIFGRNKSSFDSREDVTGVVRSVEDEGKNVFEEEEEEDDDDEEDEEDEDEEDEEDGPDAPRWRE
jgi:hypothetical protein